MEIRKVQVTGGSTYVVSLPKDWARKEGIDSGSELELHPKEGSLILEHRGGEEVGEGEMDITGLEGEEITRAVLSMYVSGFDILRFRSDRISSDQRRSLREASQGLAGLEVIEETGETVVFQDLLDSSQLSVHRTVSRMRLIAKSMFGDSVKSLVSDDDSISEDVIERDDDVDRMFAMVSRIFRSALREAVTEESLGITREECFDYHTAARQMERVADHATKIAEVSNEIEGPVGDELREGLDGISEMAIGVVDDSLDALLELEGDEAIDLANSALDSVREIEGRSRELSREVHNLDPETAQRLGLVIDSISRTGDYGANIAETALDSAAPKP